MAKLVETIEVTDKHRPCWYIGKEKKKAIFHRWILERIAVGESPVRGGHPAGVIATAFALIETEDGAVWRVYPENIQFADHGEFEEYKWEE